MFNLSTRRQVGHTFQSNAHHGPVLNSNGASHRYQPVETVSNPEVRELVVFKCGDHIQELYAWKWFETLHPDIALKFVMQCGSNYPAIRAILEAFAELQVCHGCAHREVNKLLGLEEMASGLLDNGAGSGGIDDLCSNMGRLDLSTHSSHSFKSDVSSLPRVNSNPISMNNADIWKLVDQASKNHDVVHSPVGSSDSDHTSIYGAVSKQNQHHNDFLRNSAIAAISKLRTELPMHQISRKLARLKRAKTERERHDFLRDVSRNTLRILCGEDLLPYLVVESPDDIIDCVKLGNWVQKVATYACSRRKQRQLLCRGYEIAAAIRTVLCYKECGMKTRGSRVPNPDNPGKDHQWLIKGFRYKFNLSS